MGDVEEYKSETRVRGAKRKDPKMINPVSVLNQIYDVHFYAVDYSKNLAVQEEYMIKIRKLRKICLEKRWHENERASECVREEFIEFLKLTEKLG